MSTEQLLDQPENRVIELDIDGMTCASCVSRVERKLGKLDGVTATVNLPLNRPASQSLRPSPTPKSPPP